MNPFDATPQPSQTPNPYDSTPRPRATNNPFDATPAPTQAPGSRARPSAAMLAKYKSLWLKAGGDPKAADTMAYVGANESGGDFANVNKKSGATGAWQLLGHGQYDSTDPLTNAKGAVALYNARRARGQTGFEDWDSSRHSGAFGGWEQYLNQPIAATPTPSATPKPSATPAPKPTASANPFDHLAKPTPQPTAGQSPHPRPKDLYGQRLPTQESPMDTIFNALDIPLMAYSAWQRQQVGAPGGFDDLLTMLGTGRINEAAQRYGVSSPEQLKVLAEKGDAQAAFFLNHPTLAGFRAGAAEFANPAQYAVGGVFGKPVEWGFKFLSQVPALRGVFNMLSPFRGVAVAGGEEGKRALQSLAVRVASDPARAQAESIRIFGGLSPVEQQDVVHLFQSKAWSQGEAASGFHGMPAQHIADMSKAAVRTTDPKRLAILEQRANKLDEFVTSISAKKVGAGILDPLTAAERPRHISLGGAFEHPDEATGFQTGWPDDPEAEFRGGRGAKPLTEATEHRDATHPTLAHAQKYGGVPIRADWSPVVAVERWATSSLQRLDFEDALKSVPKSLVQDAKYHNVMAKRTVIEHGYKHEVPYLKRVTDYDPATAPKDKNGNPMRPWADAQRLYPELRDVDSPTLERSLVSPAFAQWLAKNRTRIYNPGLTYLPDTSIRNKVLNAGLHAWDHLNEYQRRAILLNPLIHPVFNLSQNALAAGVPFHEVAGLVTKSVINTLGGGKLLDKFLPQSAAYQQALEAALRDGALAEMKRGDTRMLASRFRDLNPAQWPKKLLDEAGAWNNRNTFGKYGEEAFATTMYRHLTQRMGIDGKEAAGLVREALGNYQNVAQHGIDAVMSRTIFFYPWLKGNLPFWTRTLVRRPQNIAAPHQAARANNLLVADPSETDPKHPRYAKDFQWVIGDKQHGFQTVTPILPQRMLNDVFSLASMDPGTIVNSALRVVQNRAVPGVKVVAQGIETAVKPAASPLDPRNFNTLFDKKAPRQEQWKQLATNIVGELAPIPVVQNAVQNGLKRGFSASELERSIRDRGIGTFSYDRLSKPQEKQLSRARTWFDARVKAIPGGLDASEKQRRLQKFYDTYSKRVHKILNEGEEAPATGAPAPAPGATPNAFDQP